MELKALTRTLCAVCAPSGDEDALHGVIRDYLADIADEISVDALGNLLAVKRGSNADAGSVMLSAHMDEVGLMVTAVEDGFLRFAPLGGVDARMLPAREVRVLSDPPVNGVIDTLPPHLLKPGESENAVSVDRLCIDTGLSHEEAETLCPPGTRVVLPGGVEELMNGSLCGRALDNRSCVAIAMKAFELLAAEERRGDLVLLLTSQEEVGSRGAAVGAFGLRPDAALVLDVTHAVTPDASDVPCRCGKGAAIGIGPNMNPSVTRRLIALAEEKDIPWQPEPLPGSSGTDAAVLQLTEAGLATGLISLPLKYMHTPSEVVRVEDMQSVLRLVTAFVTSMGEV